MTEHQDKLTRRLAQEGATQWIRLERLKDDVPVSCIDGRQCNHTVGAPGGNMGEFILLLAVLEWYVDGVFDETMVERFFEEYLKAFHRFYKHTDDGALARLGAYLAADARLEEIAPKVVDTKWLTSYLRAVPEAHQEAFLDALVMVEHVGCGHIKQLLTSPDVYRIRPGLAESAMRVYFRALWRGNEDVDFVVLEGAHDEEAVLAFHTREMITDETMVPAIRPLDEELRVFVNHIPALRYLRWRGLRLFLESGVHPGLETLEPWTVILEIERLGERHFDETLRRLAPGLPRRRVSFEAGHYVP